MPGSSPLELFAATAPGLETITAGELRRLGVRSKSEAGGVSYRGELESIYETNLWLRTASRVVARLARFHASTFHELERRAKRVPWTDFLPTTGSVRVRVTCRKSRLYHSDAVGERVLAAIARSAPAAVDLATESRAGYDADEDAGADTTSENPAQLFIVRIVHDECEVSADSSGDLLHRRGYRQEIARAPLRETLAAAMVLASGWRPGDPLIDPMCGSGTIPIEAALLARGMPPGAKRRFAFMDWPTFDENRWNGVLERAQASVKPSGMRRGGGGGGGGEVTGSDRDAGAVEAASRNATRAGVDQDVGFAVEALSSSLAKLEDIEERRGWVITNPPYGVRIGDIDELRNLYAKLGFALKARPRWRLGILTSDGALARQIGLPMRARFSTRNGGIPVAFLAQEKVVNRGAHSHQSGVGRSVAND